MQFEKHKAKLLQNLFALFELMADAAESIIRQNDGYKSVEFKNNAWPRMNFDFQDKVLDQDWEKIKLQIETGSAPPYFIWNPEQELPNNWNKIIQDSSRNIKWAAMYCRLSAELNYDLNKGQIIHEVKSANELSNWIKVAELSLMNGKSLDVKLFEKMLRKEEISLFIGKEDGEAVSVSMLFKQDEIAGIYMVGTLEEQRRKGWASKMTKIAMQKGNKLGCQFAILQATPAGRGVYEKLGWETWSEIEVWGL